MRALNFNTLMFGAVFATVLASSGCARRTPLTPKELERVQTEAGVNPLRVYTERKLLVLYEKSNVDAEYDVNKTIVEGSDKELEKVRNPRNIPGLILEIAELNGKPLLWVTFDQSCKEASCAYGFVETEDRKYRLVTLPKREGYKDPKAYRACVWKKRRLQTGKLASLAESNEVYLVKKGNGKILTMQLEVKKVTSNKTKTRTRRNRGID